MTLQQFIAAGGFSLFLAIITALLTYKQVTKVANTESSTTIGVRRLENEQARQNLWHDDLVAAREQTEKERNRYETERTAYLVCITENANLKSESKRVGDDNTELMANNKTLRDMVEALDIEKRQLQTKVNLYEGMTIAMLRAKADEMEQEQRAQIQS